MSVRVALVIPPLESVVSFFKKWHLRANDFGAFPPLGILYVATFLKQKMPDAEIKVIDCPSQKIGYQELEWIFREFRPEILGICTFTVCLVDVLKVARLAKTADKNVHICAGGPHLFVYPRQTLVYPDIDSIVIGEGEYVFFELVKQIRDGRRTKGPDGLYFKSDLDTSEFRKAGAVDLDSLPVFDISFIDRKVYHSTVGRRAFVITFLTSRGCPYRCTFCDVPYKVFRGRNIDNIMEEIRLRLKQGFKEIFFYDDTFNINPQRVIELSEKIIRAGLKFEWSFRGRVNATTLEMLRAARKAGCRRIHFGIETATDAGLRELKKDITIEQVKNALSWSRQAGIKTIGDFILGLPFEKSRQEVLHNIKKLIALRPDYAQFSSLELIPGTQIYASAVARGIVRADAWDSYIREPRADFEPPFWDEYLSREELAELTRLAYRKFYARPGYILKKLFTLGSIHELKMSFQGALKLFFGD